MADTSLFSKVDVKVQQKSGFDKSHMNLLTTKCGTLTPILCDEVIPNTDVNVKLNLSASLPPLASETFMRVDLKAEAFFVPYRLLYGGFEDWMCDNPLWTLNGTGTQSQYKAIFPSLFINEASAIAPGSLADYLGFSPMSGTTTNRYQNILPYVAYHKIYDDWYRNSLVQTPVFKKLIATSGNLTASTQKQVGNLPWLTFSAGNAGQNVFTSSNSACTFNDGVKITSLRQRNFGMDYFSTATPEAQNGDAAKVSMNVPLTGETSGQTNFTIAALRAANSMQQFLERNNLAGNRFVDRLRAQYGANLNDGVAQRALLLGSASFPVYSKGIYQTANATGNTTNPFDGSVGAQFGSAYASGSDFIIKGFRANEPGIIMVLVSLVPQCTYGSGLRRYLTHYVGADGMGDGYQSDMANPILQNVGNQPIYSYELTSINGDDTIFGYTDRYAEWKTINDQLHGLLRDGQSLQSFALQRTFKTSGQTIGNNFLKIPTDYMDQVTAVLGNVSNYGVWIDSYIDYKVSMPLARYAIPSLQDPAYEHGVDVSLNRAGTHL